MSNQVIVYKARTNVVRVSLGMDVSADTITSQIRTEPDVDAPLLGDWDVTYLTDGTDGELVLTMDDLITSQIKAQNGYMDLKRVLSSGEPVAVFDTPLEVVFRGAVTE